MEARETAVPRIVDRGYVRKAQTGLNGKELPWALDSDGVLVVPEKLGGYFVRLC